MPRLHGDHKKWYTKDSWKIAKQDTTSAYAHQISAADGADARLFRFSTKEHYANIIKAETDDKTPYDPPAYTSILNHTPDDIHTMVLLRTGGSQLLEHQRARFTASGIETGGKCQHRKQPSDTLCLNTDTFHHALNDCNTPKRHEARQRLVERVKRWCREAAEPARLKLPDLPDCYASVPSVANTWEKRGVAQWTEKCLGCPPPWPRIILAHGTLKSISKRFGHKFDQAEIQWRDQLRQEWAQFLHIVVLWAREYKMVT